MLRLTCLTLLLLPFSLCQEDNSEFLLENAKICGDPFSDPIWIPVLDVCTMDCDQTKEYCVENEDLVQQCKPLPEECQKLLAQRRRVLAGRANFAAGVKSVITGDARDSSSEEGVLDRVVEKSVAKRAKFPGVSPRSGVEGAVVAGEAQKKRSADTTRHRVKRI